MADQPPQLPESPPAESFGRYLIRERELRGMTLQQVADTTRIGASNLKALEQDDQSRLPARVFVLGYIRAYAQAIGLDADQAVLRYDELTQKTQQDNVLPAARKGSRALILLVIVGVLVAAAVAWHFGS